MLPAAASRMNNLKRVICFREREIRGREPEVNTADSGRGMTTSPLALISALGN